MKECIVFFDGVITNMTGGASGGRVGVRTL